jgi:hypothetical protein
VRLFIDAHLPDKSDWTDSAKRAAFAQAKADKVREHALDGVFFDYEGNDLDAAHKQAYVQLAKDTSKALAALENNNATIFICVGGRPTYEWRDYPYADLAAHSEFLFIMGYDMHFWDDYTCVLKGTCSAAEAALPDLQDGVKAYAAAVDPQKLVLGLPWYGQRYTDVVLPFNRGQIDYKTVLQAFDQKGLVAKKELDKTAMSWKITCKGSCDVESGKGGNVVYYDDAETLAPKYALAREHGLLGVGMWKADNLPVPDDKGHDPHKAERQAMWSAIASWKNKTTAEIQHERENEILAETLTKAFAPPPPTTTAAAATTVVHIVQTSEQSDRLSPQPGVAFSPTKSSKATRTIKLPSSSANRNNAANAGTTIKGFGGAFTDSVAEVFSQLNSTLQETVLEALWGATGNRYSLARLTIGSTDFSTSVYNYNMNPDDSTPDYDQSKFSIKHDEDKIIPLIHRAQKKAQDGRDAAAAGIRFLSSSWSPPAWMKRPYLALKGHMRNSAKPGMKDDPKIFESYALYLSKYVSAYKAAGIDVEMMTIQNEVRGEDRFMAGMFSCARPTDRCVRSGP